MKPYQPKIEWKDPASLVPYPMNAKAHPEAQIDKVAGSIAAFGFDQPIVVDEQGMIIKGHARREASLKLGLKKVPVLVRDDMTEADKRGSRLADNRTAESDWFPETLALELKALEEMDFDLGLTGFDLDELEEMGIGQEGDPAPEDPGPQIDRAAELWKLTQVTPQ
jgi:ParB-like chromosome segregation protein Spo0J